MAEKFKPIKESELPSIVDRALKSSVTFYDSKLSREREKVLDYYNGKLPAPMHAGNSKYVSMDVFDAVESMKADLLETFSAGSRIVEFDPQDENDVEDARDATDYCDYVVHRQNDAFRIFHDTIQDGLTARVGVVQVHWDECYDEETEEFSNIEAGALEALGADPSIIEIEAEYDEDTGLFDGELTRKVNKSQVRIEVVPPEEFLISPNAVSIPSAPVVARRTRKTRSELLEMGFDAAKVKRIGSDDTADLTLEPERIARFEATGGGAPLDEGELQEQSEGIMVHQVYLRLDMKGDGKTRLYKITKAGNVILDKEECAEHPFLAFTPLPRAHAFYGANYAANVIPTQNARTVLMRGILDHTVISNNPRYMVVKGSVTNPKELIENRVGGLVNVTRPDGILPFPQNSLNPFVFQTIQLLDEDKEETTGISKLSQGMSKDAISKQNSQGMVQDLVSLSQQRQKIIARQFAAFVKQLYLRVYGLVLANERSEKVVEVAGSFKRISPSLWRERTSMTVQMTLGFGAMEREAQKLMMLHQSLATDPGAAPYYDIPQRHAMHSTILEKLGIRAVSKYLKPIETVEPPQPDPMLVKQLEIEERKVAAQEVVSQASAEKVQANAMLEQMRIELDSVRAQMEDMRAQRELDRKEFEATSKVSVAVEELEMAKEQMAQSPENTTAIVSPNS